MWLGRQVARALLSLLKHHLSLAATPALAWRGDRLVMDLSSVDTWSCSSEQPEEHAVGMAAAFYDWMFQSLSSACPAPASTESAWAAREGFCEEFRQDCRWFRWGVSGALCSYAERRLCFTIE